MQKKYFKEKSKQFSTWYQELIKKNMFGGKKNLKVFNEWEKFYSNAFLIKKERSFSLFYKIIKYPNNINKIKLFLLFILPEKIAERIISFT